MSKPLAIKVSTSLSENVQIGPNMSICCVVTIIFQHCLNPLGHGVHQSFTGCHWIPLPLLHDDITETVDIRDPALLHLPFEDDPQMLNRAKVWRHAWPVSHLYSQLLSKAVVVLEVCLWSLSCWNTALRLSLRREGNMLCFSMSQYKSAALTQPQTMTLAPPCLTVGKTHLYLYSSPGGHHTCLTPSGPNKFILVSSDHRTWFQ